jgi:hypothetical protein
VRVLGEILARHTLGILHAIIYDVKEKAFFLDGPQGDEFELKSRLVAKCR